MLIIFGSNNFLIKRYNSFDLGLPQGEGWEYMSFEVRQRYAHIFWIPFFPIGKLWAIKKQGDSGLYEMPPAIQELIKAQHQRDVKTPWYSWSLFLLAAAIGGFFFIQDSFYSYQYAAEEEAQMERYALMIDYPTTGDIYNVEISGDDIGKYGYIDTYLKVVADLGDQVEVITPYEDMYADPDYYEPTIGYDEAFQHFDRVEQFGYNRMRISKEQLKAAINMEDEYPFYSNIPGIGEIELSSVERRPLDDY